MVVKPIYLNIILLWYSVGVVLADRSDGLPFTCPYKIPENLPQPDNKVNRGGGLTPTYDTTTVSTGNFAQFEAARALVPCGAQAIQVFIEQDIRRSNNTVSVIYVFDESVEKLKKWLKEKLYAETYDNPIRDAVHKQCPEIAYELSNPYASKLTGDEILNVLCEENCTRSTNPPGYHVLTKRSQTYNSYNTPEYQEQQHHYPSQQLSYNTPQQQYTATNSSAYQPPPNAYQPHQPVYPKYPIHPQYPTVSHQHAGDGYNLVSEHQKQAHSPYHKKVSFDDAPKILYGVAVRRSRYTPCEENKQRCEELISQDKIVQCEQPRFSGCDGEWMDCLPEDESYLREAGFYDTCKLFELGAQIDLEGEGEDTCFQDRCSIPEDEQLHVGFTLDNCTCEAPKPEYSPNYYTRPYNTRFTRQDTQVVMNCKIACADRVNQASLGAQQQKEDCLASCKTIDYNQAQTVAYVLVQADVFDEEDFA